MKIGTTTRDLSSRLLVDWLAHVRDAALSLSHPLSCLHCGCRTASAVFCEKCLARVIARAGANCPRCALPQGPSAWFDAKGCSECRGRSLGFDEALAIGPYRELLREACLTLKHGSGAWLAAWLADILWNLEGERLTAINASVVVPVPLHWRRRWRRGFNQSEEIARQLAHRLRLPLRRALRRTESGEVLAGQTRTERLARMRHAFRPRRGFRLKGETVILVDDILTSGATSGAAARALKAGGAGRVVVAVLARAESR